MKILVTLPLSYKDAEFKSLFDASEHLRRLGHNVYNDVDLRAKYAKSSKKSEQSKYFAEIEKLIKDSDILLTDVTVADIKIGYEIARALDEKKIVVALQKESKGTKKENPYISQNPIRTLILKTYKNGDVVSVVNKAIEEAKSKMDTKFILIISPEIDRYLDWAAQTKRMHKAQIVRNSIESAMLKDKEYKNYLNS